MWSFGRPEKMGETKVSFFPRVCNLVFRGSRNLLLLPTSPYTQTELIPDVDCILTYGNQSAFFYL